MKAVVVGLGSMGKRRIRLMREFFSEINVCGVDTNEQRRAQTAEQFQVECYASLKEAVTAAPDIGFVCTSPLSHSAIIKEMLENNISVFTEINLVSDGYEKNCALAQKKGLELFLSSTPIYRRETQYIERRAQEAQCPLFYRYHVGQYLPDWHPWENYRDFFVGDRRTNGCREIFGIELPWLVRAFGDIESTAEVKARQSSLVIDYADSYLVTLSHSSGICGQLAVDIVSRKAVRDFELFGEKLYLRWGGTPSSLSEYDFERKEDMPIDTYGSVRRDERYAENIIENAYVDEMAAFFAVLRGEKARRHTFEHDKELLRIIDEIER